MFKKAFTLMEVNLAVALMASGVLTVVILFSLGYRETRQSREDVASAAASDAIISRLAMAAGSTNLVWSRFYEGWAFPNAAGWSAYFNTSGKDVGIVDEDPSGICRQAYVSAMQKLSSCVKPGTTPDFQTGYPEDAFKSGVLPGLVVIHEEGSAVVKIAFRATKMKSMFLAAPLYFTEVRFQGIADE